MQAMKADRTNKIPQPKITNLFIPGAFILIILIILALYVTNAFKAFQAASLPQAAVSISPGVLEKQYGLRVNLLAVTAAGGMVDLRLKMLDGEKAKTLLQDKKNFPSLLVQDGNIMLKASEDTSNQEIKFENNGGLFLLFPNTANAVKPGSNVILVFGDLQVEPIIAK
jgi:hypothetical protein